MDTEVLIALVSSLLTIEVPDTSTILDAIVAHNGDVQLAANALNVSKPVVGQKRKRGLDAWLKPNSKVKGPTEDLESTKTNPIRPVASTSSASSKPAVDLMKILQQPKTSSTPSIPRLPPLTLATPGLVAQHTPCTLHPSVLPAELACRLFYTMIDAAERDWKRNQWWLFGRMVESPHRTSFFARGLEEKEEWGEAAQYWYNGRPTVKPPIFPDAMEEACLIIEKVVNDEIKKRKRFPLEWDGGDESWKANVAATNCYEGGKESVGPHSDILTYLGPYPTIASLSLGTERVFSLREVVPTEEADKRHARTFNIPVTHNSLTIMHASTQERYKHSVPPQRAVDAFRPAFPPTHTTADIDIEPHEKINAATSRINITFRFYRPDFRAHTTPRCKCGIPMGLRPDKKGTIQSYGKEKSGYWWTCAAGSAKEGGKGCDMWQIMDMEKEGRGPVVGGPDALS